MRNRNGRAAGILAVAITMATTTASAQSTYTRQLSIDTLTEVCLPFWAEQELEAGLVNARAQNWRRLDQRSRAEGEPPFAYHLALDPGGNRLTLEVGETPTCTLYIPEGTVERMAEAAGPVLEAAGYVRIGARRADPAKPIVAWRNAAGDVAAVSISDSEPRVAALMLSTDEWSER